jgi:cell division protein FtsB
MNPAPKGYWVVNKQICVTLVLFLLIHTVLLVWRAANLQANVEENSRRIIKLERLMESIPAMERDIQWMRSFLEKIYTEKKL